MLHKVIAVCNLILALFLIALVILYAAIIIPVSLGVFIGFVLILWLYAHLIDGVFLLSRKIKRWFSSRV